MKKWFALFLFVASTASAQTVLNPTRVQFTPSPDHSVMIDTVPLVTRYELRHFLSGATTPFSVEDLGKPTPNGLGIIDVPIKALPVNSTSRYNAKVAAIGPTGEGVSLESNPYFFVGAPAPGGKPGVSK